MKMEQTITINDPSWTQEKSIDYHKSQLDVADKFYYSIGCQELIRLPEGSKEREEQRINGIDVTATFVNNSLLDLTPYPKTIMERFRGIYWNDAYFNIWKNYDQKIIGTIVTTKADLLECFYPNSVLEFDRKNIEQIQLILNTIITTTNWEDIDSKLDGNYKKVSCCAFPESNIRYTILKRIARSEKTNEIWSTYSVVFGYDALNQLGVNYKEYILS